MSKQPVEIDCLMSSAGLGVRYRDFKNTPGQGDIYLGVDDLGKAGNRTQADYTWSDPGLGMYSFTFTYNVAKDRLEQYLINVKTNTTPKPNPLYYPSSSGGLVSDLKTKGIDITTLNAFQILVSNKENDTLVELMKLQLITPNGTYDMGDYQPPVDTSTLIQYEWPADGSIPSDGFTFQGMITLNGDFNQGSEMTKVEISVFNCQDIQPPICLAAGTRVTLADSRIVTIEKLEPGDLILDSNNNPVAVSQCVKTGQTKSFVLIKQDALGLGLPDRDLLIVPGHPVLIQGREVDCLHLCNNSLVTLHHLDTEMDIYTICTERRTFVHIQGLHVGTWGEDAFSNFTCNDSIGRKYASSWTLTN